MISAPKSLHWRLQLWHGGILLNGAAPALDAITTGHSVVARCLLIRRFIESWYSWIVSDILYWPLHLSRGLTRRPLLSDASSLMGRRG